MLTVQLTAPENDPSTLSVLLDVSKELTQHVAWAKFEHTQELLSCDSPQHPALLSLPVPAVGLMGL